MKRALAGACLLLALGLGACRRGPQGPVLALVNGEPISAADLDSERAWLQPHPPADPDLLEDLIDQALILQDARRQGISLDGQDRRNAEAVALAGTDKVLLLKSLEAQGQRYEDWVRRVHRAALMDEVVRRQVRTRLELSPQEVQDHYWENLPSYRDRERKTLRQIFTRSRAAAEKALRELELGEPFDQVAARRGEGPEAPAGGLLGDLSSRNMPKPLAEALKGLKPGQRSKIVRSPWGWHIVLLERKTPGHSATLEEASPEARALLLARKEQPAYQAWLARLREQAKIERTAPPLAAVPTPTKGTKKP